MKLLNTIKAFAFWGICFLLILVIGFDVRIQDVLYIAISREMNLSAFCICLLGSVILFPILVAISAVVILKSGLIIADMLVLDLLPFLWTPYKGIDIRDFITLNKSDLDAKGIFLAIGILLRRFIEMALWWFIVIFGLYTVYHQRNNAIQVAIKQKVLHRRLLSSE